MAKAGSGSKETPAPKPTAPAATPASNDPIEGVKITDKPVLIPPPPPPVVEAPAAPPAVPTPEQYRVKEKTTISLHGQFITLNPDDIVSAASYGPDGLRRIKESNVPMERIEDLKKVE